MASASSSSSPSSSSLSDASSSSVVVCRHFARGHCFLGFSCKFRHESSAAVSREADAEEQARIVELAQRLCRNWVRTYGNCQNAEKCPFFHPPLTLQDGDAAVRYYEKVKFSSSRYRQFHYVKDDPQQQQQQQTSTSSGVVDDNNHDGVQQQSQPRPQKPKPMRKGRKAVRNRDKSAVLRRFVLTTFGGVEALKAGAGVLDIAGGNAELSWQLRNLNGIAATVVDPRPPATNVLRRLERRWQLGFYDRNPVFRQHNTAQPTSQPVSGVASEDEQEDDDDNENSQDTESSSCTVGGRTNSLRHDREADLPNRLRVWFDHVLWDALLGEASTRIDDAARERIFRAAREKADKLVWSEKGLVDAQSEVAKAPKFCQQSATAADDQMDTRAAIEKWEIAQDVLRNCSVVIGLHPDQATGAIVQFALRYRKPFAVVPCCVHAKSFPERKLANGKRVRAYEDIIEWIKEMDPTIQETSLDIGGRNRVLWWIPEELRESLGATQSQS